MEYVSRENQDLVDISIQQFGELESGLFQILTDNPSFGLNSPIPSQTKLTVNNESLGNVDIKTFFSNNNFIVVNADEATIFGGSLGDYNNDYNNDYS